MIWFKDIEDITKEDIDELIENKILEHDLLEYKKELKIGSDKERKEFLKDVSALANGRGGLIVYGIAENEEGFPDEINGIEIENIDKEERRLQDIICAGIEPIINTFKIRFISFEDNKYVILIKLLRSWNLPHRVIFKGNDKFYVRRNKKVDRIAIEELKMMFNLNYDLKQKVLEFRDKRIRLLKTVYRNQFFLLNIFPLHNFLENSFLDIKKMKNQFIENVDDRWRTEYNYDGLFFRDGDKHRINKYYQIYRSGSIEILNKLCVEHSDYVDHIPVSLINDVLEQDIPKIIKFYKGMNINPPLFITLSLLNVTGKFLSSTKYYLDKRKFIEGNLAFPEIILENYSDFNFEPINDVLDILWQSCGYDNCKIYIN